MGGGGVVACAPVKNCECNILILKGGERYSLRIDARFFACIFMYFM